MTGQGRVDPSDDSTFTATGSDSAATEAKGADYVDLTYEAIDDTTVSITWPTPQPVMATRICPAKILPPSRLEAANWDVPVGPGPLRCFGFRPHRGPGRFRRLMP